MKIKEIQLKKFKRFTDTVITNIPESARLVLMVGPNGCGKSSLIDAVYVWHRFHFINRNIWDSSYHMKQSPGEEGNIKNSIVVNFHDPQPADKSQRMKAVYVRTAYRNDPEFQLAEISRVEPAVMENRINRLIDNDKAVGINYKRLVSQGFEDVYENAPPELTMREFREQSIGEIRNAILRLFPGLELNSLGNPLSSGTFKFDKGESKAFLYKNLSGGEKAAFDLLLDLIIKKREFDNTVFFIDEPEAHISPYLQNALLEEMFRIIPENSQLWLATHSVGMIRKARDLEKLNPGSVVFLDFDGADLELQEKICPTVPNRVFWKRAMKFALDDLADYLAPEHVVLCEGGILDGGNDFDAECYNEIFKNEYPQSVFLGVGNADDVINDSRNVKKILQVLAPQIQVTCVVDRDDRNENEIASLKSRGVRVLSRRTIESYLLDDMVLRAMCEAFSHPEQCDQFIREKQKALEESIRSGGPSDDLKRPSGQIYNSAKHLFKDRKLGSNARAFMKITCSYLRHDSEAYITLKEDIFGG